MSLHWDMSLQMSKEAILAYYNIKRKNQKKKSSPCLDDLRRFSMTEEDTTLLLAACENAVDRVAIIGQMMSRSPQRPIYCVPKPNENYWERVLQTWDNQQYWNNLRLHR